MSYKYTVGGTYKSRNRDELDKLRQKYIDTTKNYEPSKDTGYQEYAKMMREQGQLAMEDTVGKSAAATGGYGNSYAQTAGQQVYNDYARDITAAQDTFYDRALSRIAGEMNMLESREAADKAAWEEDYLDAYNEAVNSGSTAEIAAVLGMSEDDYNASVMASGTRLGDEQIKSYIGALMNGDETGKNGAYYNKLLNEGYNVGNVSDVVNAYAMANGLGINMDAEGNITHTTGHTKEITNERIRGLDNLNEGQNFHVVMHKDRDGSSDNLDVQLGGTVAKSDNSALYNYAETAGKGLVVYNDTLYYYDGTTVHAVNAQSGKEDEYTDLINLIKNK